MKYLNNWWVPVRDEVGNPDILREWETKHEKVLSLVKKNNRVLQAGGCVGVFPKGLSKHFKEVITFEPVEDNWDCLEANLDGIDNIRKFNSGLSDRKTSVGLYKMIANNCGAVQLKEKEFGDMQLVAFDTLMIGEINLIWFDLEGYEVKALLGAKNTIKKYKPIIVLENNGLIHEFPGTREGSEGLRKWMFDTFGYTLADRLARDDIYIPKRGFFT
jgi:FkbM family methyltransferase